MKLTSEDVIRVVSGIPADIREIMHDTGAYLAGGAVRALVAGEPVSDFDLFSVDKDAALRLATTVTAKRYGVGATTSMTTDNAITVLTVGRAPVQCILKFSHADPGAMIAMFDFTVVQAAVWLRDDWRSVCSDGFYPDLAARRLTYTYPIGDGDACGSILRMRKYLAKGYTIQAPSLAGIVARLVCTTPELTAKSEKEVADAVLGRMREVDPLNVVDGAFAVAR